MSDDLDATTSVAFDKTVEPAPKRARKTSPKLPKYINKYDGKGNYIRFSIRTKNLEEANNLLSSLYKDNLLDDSFAHAYSRSNTTGDAFISLHVVGHVTSRDYDFFFWRKKLPNAHFKISVYPDDSYPRAAVSREVVQSGTVCGSTNSTGFNPCFSGNQSTMCNGNGYFNGCC